MIPPHLIKQNNYNNVNFLLYYRQTDRQTDRRTDRQTDRQ